MALATDPSPSEEAAGTWSANTKLLASLVFLVLIGLSLWRFKHLLHPITISVVVAYLLHPVVTRLTRLPFLSRAMASVVAFVIFFTISVYLLMRLGSAAYTQLEQLLQDMPQMVMDAQTSIGAAVAASPFLQGLLARPELQGLGVQWDWDNSAHAPGTGWDTQTIVNQALTVLNPILRQSSSVATNLARGTFHALATTFLIVILSLYIVIDIPRVEDYIGNMAPIRSVQNEMKALWRRFAQIWGAYLRGQINISLLMFIIVSTLLSLLGVNNAFGLGLLAGAMEFLPLIGPMISFGVAVLTAFFQESTLLGLSTVNYTLLVAVVLLGVNLLESNVLVPRILGNELRLHSLVVLISVLMGTSLAGILGAVLAAPIAATVKLMGTYTWHRILDQPPHFLHEEISSAERDQTTRWQALRDVVRHLKRPRLPQTETGAEAPEQPTKAAGRGNPEKAEEE